MREEATDPRSPYGSRRPAACLGALRGARGLGGVRDSFTTCPPFPYLLIAASGPCSALCCFAWRRRPELGPGRCPPSASGSCRTQRPCPCSARGAQAPAPQKEAWRREGGGRAQNFWAHQVRGQARCSYPGVSQQAGGCTEPSLVRVECRGARRRVRVLPPAPHAPHPYLSLSPGGNALCPGSLCAGCLALSHPEPELQVCACSDGTFIDPPLLFR